jgi:hypothetical protein
MEEAVLHPTAFFGYIAEKCNEANPPILRKVVQLSKQRSSKAAKHRQPTYLVITLYPPYGA